MRDWSFRRLCNASRSQLCSRAWTLADLQSGATSQVRSQPCRLIRICLCERLWPLARWRTESDASVFRSAWLTDLPPIHWGFGGSCVDLPAYQLCEREAPSVRIPFSLGKCKRARCRVAVRLAAEFAARLASELKRQRVASLAARLIIALAAERLPRRLHR